MVRTLDNIREEYKKVEQEKPSLRRNMKLVDLMNELEKDYHTMKIYQTSEALQKDLEESEAISLYRAISLSRTNV